MAVRPFAALVRFLAGVEPDLRPFTERIAAHAEELRAQGYNALPALAAAEATELLREYRGLRLDRVVYDEDLLRWSAVYEAGPVRTPTMIRIPLEHATEATQMGIASFN